LVERMGISRGSVRQAMKSLEILGVISIRPGDGTYINETISKKSFNQLIFALLIARPSLREIVDFRYAMERNILERIFTDADKDHIDRLLEELETNVAQQKKLLEQNATTKEIVTHDQNFHLLLSEHCGNAVFHTIYSFIMDYLKPYMYQTAHRQTSTGENFSFRDHQIIVDALKKKDFKAVEDALQQSLDTWKQFMNEEDFVI
ncbi:MAG: FCD domain-containing protein, partial [Lachnospiraceae bacterium]|nr:FCD domain-containing protein [Lachnospiraceae bacterium]